MSKPEIQQTINGFTFAWPEGIMVIVSRLRVHTTDGRVTGEILIKNEKATLYPQTQMNFSADRTRNALAKTLKERYDSHDWQQIVDQLSYHVQDKARQGEPVIELWTHEELKPPEYVVDPIIMKNQPNILFGPPESGKTQLAMLMCLLAMLPWRDNNLGLKVRKEPTPVLWLDYEADSETARYNFTRITHGAVEGDIYLPYRRCRMRLADDIEAIADHVNAVGAKMVVIDSVAKAARGDLDKSDSPNDFFGALDQLNCTSLILAHTKKGDGDTRKTIYGSTFFEAYARSVWELRATRDGDEMNIGLWDNKANFRRKHDPMAFQLFYHPDRITIAPQNIKTIEDFLAHLSTNDRIYKALQDGPKSPKELKALLPDVAFPNLYVELGRMVHRNRLVKLGEGKEVLYALAAREDEGPQ